MAWPLAEKKSPQRRALAKGGAAAGPRRGQAPREEGSESGSARFAGFGGNSRILSALCFLHYKREALCDIRQAEPWRDNGGSGNRDYSVMMAGHFFVSSSCERAYDRAPLNTVFVDEYIQSCVRTLIISQDASSCTMASSRPQRRRFLRPPRQVTGWFQRRPETIVEDEDCEFHNVQARQRALDTAAVEDEVSTLTIDVSHVISCRTIDEAMQGLSDSGCTDDLQAYSSPTLLYDWILDGHVSFSEEEKRSVRLIQELKGPNLDELIQQYETKEREGIEKEDSIGETHKSEASEEDDDDDEFGDFQTAQPTSTDDAQAITKKQSITVIMMKILRRKLKNLTWNKTLQG